MYTYIYIYIYIEYRIEYIRYLIITYSGKESEEEYIERYTGMYIFVTELLCYIPATL